MTEQPWAEVPEEQWAQMVGDSVAAIGATEQLTARVAAVVEAPFSASCRQSLCELLQDPLWRAADAAAARLRHLYEECLGEGAA